MVDNLAQLDQGGSNCTWSRVWMGPTIGWLMLPVVPELEVTSTAALTLQPYTSRVLLKVAVTQINLPKVTNWVLAQYQANQAAFDRSIWIKDYGYNAQAHNITITPFGTDTIDGLPTFTMLNDGDLIRLYPLTSLTGWYVG